MDEETLKIEKQYLEFEARCFATKSDKVFADFINRITETKNED